MIICPTCKEEIDDDSRYCDQCGQALLYCNQCGRVGVGRRCTYCGGLMVAPGKEAQQAQMESVASVGYATYGSIRPDDSRSGAQGGMPVLTLANDSLNIRIVAMNGAIIGRRKGPYTHFQRNEVEPASDTARCGYDIEQWRCPRNSECQSASHYQIVTDGYIGYIGCKLDWPCEESERRYGIGG